MQRIRVTYRKGEELQYTGNLDMHKVWERTFRRAKLQLSYSQGFHPQPKIHQSCPLPLGFTSREEILDFWLDTDESIELVREMIENTVQPGITIEKLSQIPLNDPPLQTVVKASKYHVFFSEDFDFASLEKNISDFKARESCQRSRRGKSYDLVPLVESISLINESPPVLEMQLTALPGATGRPEELLDELGINPSSVDIERVALIL